MSEKESTAKRRRRLAKPDNETAAAPRLARRATLTCARHRLDVEFLCTARCCLRELCSHCLLDHKEHVADVQPIAEVIATRVLAAGREPRPDFKDRIAQSQGEALRGLDAVSHALRGALRRRLAALSETLIVEDELYREYVARSDCVAAAAEDGAVRLDAKLLAAIKSLLKSRRTLRPNELVIETALVERELRALLARHIAFLPQGISVNSSAPGVPKTLHWFEWEKRELNLYDVAAYALRTVKLAIYFKVPPFSRSVLLADGRLFLIGGEDATSGPRRDVYGTSLAALAHDFTLHAKAPMLAKRFDFAVCHIGAIIYVIAGKDARSAVTDSVERYDADRDRWVACAPVRRRRYAAAAAAQVEVGKLYLFGGRSDSSNQVLEEVEEYDVARDVWSVLRLHAPSPWVPVEVCASAQVAMNTIIVFGGSDSAIEDSNAAYLFKPDIAAFERLPPLRRGHVFVSSPFVHGNQVFAVGNEYYVKARCVHRFDVDSRQWDLLF